MTTTRFKEGPKHRAAKSQAETDQRLLAENRERRRLAREQSSASEQMVEDYRDQLRKREEQMDAYEQAMQDDDARMERAISRGFVRRIAGVMRSEKLEVQVLVSQAAPGQMSSAYTDFVNVVAKYETFKNMDGSYNMKMIAANLRGLLYHEAGHVRFTVPFAHLVEMATGATETNRYRHLHGAWNILEDQRMETAVVSDSPRKARYLLPTIMQINARNMQMLSLNYLHLVWRKYLPERVRINGRGLFLAAHPKLTDAVLSEMEDLTTQYVMATDAQTMLDIIERYNTLYTTYVNPEYPSDDSHDSHAQPGGEAPDEDALLIPIDPSMLGGEQGDGGGSDEEDDRPEPTSLDDLSDDEVEHVLEILSHLYSDIHRCVKVQYYDPTQSGGVESDDEQSGSSPRPKDEGEDEESSAGEGDDDSDSDGDESGDGAGSEEGGDTDSKGGLSDKELDEIIKDAEEERSKGSEVENDEQAMNDAFNTDGSMLPLGGDKVLTDDEVQNRAENLSDELYQAFRASTMHKAPGWVEGQKAGQLNVLRYVTREASDTEFFRAWTNDDNPGHNITVSVLLDNSGSMADSATALAATGYACKRVCERLHVPCTVLSWSTGARVIWDRTDKAEYMPDIAGQGATDPSGALGDLFTHRKDEAQHIVIVMTDGVWSGQRHQNSLAAFRDEGVTFLGLGYAENGSQSSADSMANNLRTYGCDTVAGITDLMQIPIALEEALAEAYA